MADGVLSRIPGLAGYLSGQDRDQQQMGQLQQVGALQGILAKVQAAKQEQAFRGALSQLGPNPSQESLAQLAAQFSAPKDILTSQTASADRRAALEATNVNRQDNREQRIAELTQRGEQEIARVREAAAQQRITREEADRREAAMRENMARLGASLRPAPQVQPLVPIVGPDGKQRLVERKDAINQMPAGAGSKAEMVAAGKSDVDKDIVTLKSALDSLNEGGGITSTARGVLPNVGRWASNTAVGQTLGSMGGTHNQKARDVILQARPLLLRSIMQSSGMSAKQLDSNAELKLWLSTATDPTKGYQANTEALNNIASKYGSGAFMENGQQATGAIKPSRRSDDVPNGIDAKVWGAMTPEEKKLFK